jgi:hypothetical protein
MFGSVWFGKSPVRSTSIFVIVVIVLSMSELRVSKGVLGRKNDDGKQEQSTMGCLTLLIPRYLGKMQQGFFVLFCDIGLRPFLTLWWFVVDLSCGRCVAVVVCGEVCRSYCHSR